MPIDTDERANTRAEIAARKKKQAMGQAVNGPAIIAPPQMDDWAANVRARLNGGAQTQQPSGTFRMAEPGAVPLFYGANARGQTFPVTGPSPAPAYPAGVPLPTAPNGSSPLSSRPGVGTPAPGPFSIATRGMGGGAAPAASAAPESEAVKRIQMRRLRDEAQNRYLRGINTPTTGMDETAKQARIASIIENRNTVENIEGANAPVQRVQGPGEIVAGRAGINQQLKAVGESKRQAVLARMKADPANADKYQAELVDALRIIQDADKVLPQYGGGTGASAGLEDPRVTAIRQGQTALAAKQAQAKEGYAQLAEGDLARKQDEVARTLKMRELAGQVGQAQGERILAEEQAGAAQAKFGADPETMKAELATKRAMAEAQAKQAQAVSGAYGGATPEVAAIKGQQRQAALTMAGIDTPEAYNQFKAQAAGHLQNLLAIDDGGVALNNFMQQTIPTLQEIASNGEVGQSEAARIARDLLGQLPNTAMTFGDVALGPVIGGLNAVKKQALKVRVDRARQALMGFASGGATQ